MVTVLDVDRVIVATPNLEEAVEQFERLGLSFGEHLEFGVGDETLSARLEETGVDVLTPAGNGEIRTYLDEHGPGLYGLALRVADLDAARADLAEQGVEPFQSYTEGSFEEYFYHPRDFAGVMVILCEYDAPHSLEAALA